MEAAGSPTSLRRLCERLRSSSGRVATLSGPVVRIVGFDPPQKGLDALDPIRASLEIRAFEQLEQLSVLVGHLLAVGGELFLAGVELVGDRQVLLHLLRLAHFLGRADHSGLLANVG
jgi:hypothetical protein